MKGRAAVIELLSSIINFYLFTFICIQSILKDTHHKHVHLNHRPPKAFLWKYLNKTYSSLKAFYLLFSKIFSCIIIWFRPWREGTSNFDHPAYHQPSFINEKGIQIWGENHARGGVLQFQGYFVVFFFGGGGFFFIREESNSGI